MSPRDTLEGGGGDPPKPDPLWNHVASTVDASAPPIETLEALERATEQIEAERIAPRLEAERRRVVEEHLSEIRRVVDLRCSRGDAPDDDPLAVGALRREMTGLARVLGLEGGVAPFRWEGAQDIFAPLPLTKWLVRDLQLCPGRPAMFAGYGYSGKTIAAQSLALSLAAGRPLWGEFHTGRPMRVRHVDHDQGRHATFKRYQRLAAGLSLRREDIGDRLHVCAHPSVYLNSPGAEAAYARAFDGTDLVVIDALRGATPGEDENDSKIRSCLDVLSRVSEKTACMFIVVHHAGKPSDRHDDPRTILRGSSALFDACGSTFVIAGEKSEGGANAPKRVTHVKGAAEAEGGAVDAFYLGISDVEIEGDPKADLRCAFMCEEQATQLRAGANDPGAELERQVVRVVDAVRAAGHRGVNGKDALAKLAKMNASDCRAAVDTALGRSLIRNTGDARRPMYVISTQ